MSSKVCVSPGFWSWSWVRAMLDPKCLWSSCSPEFYLSSSWRVRKHSWYHRRGRRRWRMSSSFHRRHRSSSWLGTSGQCCSGEKHGDTWWGGLLLALTRRQKHLHVWDNNKLWPITPVFFQKGLQIFLGASQLYAVAGAQGVFLWAEAIVGG